MLRMIIVLAGLVLLTSSIAAAGLAPEIGVMGVKCWTKDDQLKHPYGFELHLLQPISTKVKLVFEYEYLTSRKTEGARPMWQMNTWERDAERNRVSIFQFGFLHDITHGRTTFLELGGGVCYAHFSYDERPVWIGWGGCSPDIWKMGIVLDASLLVTVLQDLPLVMRFGFKHRFMREETETLPSSGSYAFHEAITTTEVSWGLGYQFGRQAAPGVGGLHAY